MINKSEKLKLFRKTVHRYTLKQEIALLKMNPKKFIDYVEGVYRSFCYINIPFLVRKHVIQQFEWRIFDTNAKNCVSNGNCLCCGCDAPAVMFSSRGCSVADDKFCSQHLGLSNCYPKMLNKKDWKDFKIKNNIRI